MLRARAGLLAALLLLGCQQANPPVVNQQTFSVVAGSTEKVAVLPFATARGGVRLEAGREGKDMGDTVATFFAEALAARGVRVVPPSDMAIAFLNDGRAVPRKDPQLAAQVAARDFGATSVVLGEVLRWREKEVGSMARPDPLVSRM